MTQKVMMQCCGKKFLELHNLRCVGRPGAGGEYKHSDKKKAGHAAIKKQTQPKNHLFKHLDGKAIIPGLCD